MAKKTYELEWLCDDDYKRQLLYVLHIPFSPSSSFGIFETMIGRAARVSLVIVFVVLFPYITIVVIINEIIFTRFSEAI